MSGSRCVVQCSSVEKQGNRQLQNKGTSGDLGKLLLNVIGQIRPSGAGSKKQTKVSFVCFLKRSGDVDNASRSKVY